MEPTVVLATTASNIGWTIAILIFVAFGVGTFLNMRQARPELGSEIELAANRKEYLSDEELETTKLDRTLMIGLAGLALVAVSLPLYWLYEPARQEGAVHKYEDIFVERGKKIYDTGALCVECHGPDGVGGVKNFTILNDAGQFVASVNWQAPALNNVLSRYSRTEVLYILEYGRSATPMPAWGAKGGGPLTDQQLQNAIDYLQSIQLPAVDPVDPTKGSRAQLDAEIEKVCAPARTPEGELDGDNPPCTKADPASPGGTHQWATLGEALFNLGYYDGFSGGSYSCGRCHTKGWSYQKAEVAGGGGSLGFNLTDGQTLRRFQTVESQVDFVTKGSEDGKKYGSDGQGSGKMPGFGLNPNADAPVDWLPDFKPKADQVMYSAAEIRAIVEYERSL